MTQYESTPNASSTDLVEHFATAELTTVMVWKFGVKLMFNNDSLYLTVESNAEFQSQGQTELYNQEVIVAFGARVLSLVGRRVTALHLDDDKVLTLSFDEGSKLAVRPDQSGYESYQIGCPAGLWIG